MEREQATLPFVVPSHLSKLFGLKASVIVEGEGAAGRDGSERHREGGRERERQGLIAPVGVMVRQLSVEGGGKGGTGAYSLFLPTHVSFRPPCFCKRFLLSPPPAHPLPEGYGGLRQKARGHVRKTKAERPTNWLSGSVGQEQSEAKDGGGSRKGEEGGVRNGKPERWTS